MPLIDARLRTFERAFAPEIPGTVAEVRDSSQMLGCGLGAHSVIDRDARLVGAVVRHAVPAVAAHQHDGAGLGCNGELAGDALLMPTWWAAAVNRPRHDDNLATLCWDIARVEQTIEHEVLGVTRVLVPRLPIARRHFVGKPPSALRAAGAHSK